jgi:hypothetical protein
MYHITILVLNDITEQELSISAPVLQIVVVPGTGRVDRR